jgi:hypothetical protein
VKSRNKIQTNGSAIYGNGYKTAFEIKQEGFGTSTTDPASFTNCRYGIFADRIRLHSQNNKMVKMGTGYRAQLVRSGVAIHHNSIESSFDGIQLILCEGMNNPVTNAVENNIITFGDNSPLASYAGINIVETGVQYSTLTMPRINNNEIYFRQGSPSARYGINGFRPFRYQITWNYIADADNSSTWDGIHMEDGIKEIVSCNNINATGTVIPADPNNPSDNSAIKYLLGTGPAIECNDMDNSPNGIFIIGAVGSTQQPIRIMGNQFRNHFIGFRYGANTITLNQDFMGNLWLNNAPANGHQARHDMGINLNINQYFNLVNVNNPIPPTGWTNFPSHSPQNWFKPAPPFSPPNEECHNPYTNAYCQTHYPLEDVRLSELERLIAKDSIENEPYTAETLWMLKYALFSKLHNYPELRNDSLMYSFFNAMQNTFISGLKEIEDTGNELVKTDSALVMQIQESNEVCDSLYGVIRIELLALEDSLSAGGDITVMLQQLESITDNYNDVLKTMNDWVKNADSARVAGFDALITDNNSLQALESIEEYERTVNEIYLSTIGKEVYEFTAEQFADLVRISELCPLSGGSAVIKARSMRYLVEPKLYYDDRETCWGEGIVLRQSKEKNSRPVAIIYPNPATNEATLEYRIDEELKGHLRLFSPAGQLLYSKELKGGYGKHSFSTTHLLPGIYYVELRSDVMPVFNGKLVIIR